MKKQTVLTAVISAVAASAIAGGVAWASIPDANKVFSACMLNGVGTIRLIDKSLPSTNLMSHCTDKETAISWNQAGQPGPAGPAGPQGPKGDTGTPGKDGTNGTNGTDGKDGKDGVSPGVAQVAAGDSSHCNGAGGAAITDAAGNTAYVCSGTNGKDGQSFSGSFTSPNGNYRVDVADTGITLKGPGNSTSITVDANGATIKSATAVSVDAATDGHFKFGGSFDLTGANDGSLSFLGPLTLHGSIINEN